MMWPIYALLIWMVGVLLTDLVFSRSPSPWLWPIWLPLAIAALVIERITSKTGA